jgi:hypothetical protein
MPPRRFKHLEREFQVITEQIAHSTNAADIAQLKVHCEKICIEARMIARKLHVPEPEWSCA